MNSNWFYSPEAAKLGFDLCDLDLRPLTVTSCMDNTSVIGNNSWIFHDDTTMGTLWKGVADGRTDERTDGQDHLWSCLVAAKKANLRDFIAATGLVISNQIQIIDLSACVTLKFDGWSRITIGHFFYTTSSFVHHFKSIGEFKLELQPGNVQFSSKLAIFCPRWPWDIIDDIGKQ